MHNSSRTSLQKRSHKIGPEVTGLKDFNLIVKNSAAVKISNFEEWTLSQQFKCSVLHNFGHVNEPAVPIPI